MKILSFDVGIVNLAYCIIDKQKIVRWEIIALSERGSTFSAHIATSGVAELYLTLINQLDQRPHLLDVDIVLIEKQPSFNPKMRIIAGCLQTYFYIRGMVDKKRLQSVQFFSPKNKLKCYTGPQLDISSKNGTIVKGKYAQTKKMGVAIARNKLEENGETEFIDFFEKSKKKDDLSDCYLQALTYLTFDKAKVFNLKKELKVFLDTNLKTCSVLELMDKQFNSIHELTFPEEFEIEDIVQTLTKLKMKKYINFKYKN